MHFQSTLRTGSQGSFNRCPRARGNDNPSKISLVPENVNPVTVTDRRNAYFEFGLPRGLRMLNATSVFDSAADYVGGSRRGPVHEFLEQVGARPCRNAAKLSTATLPALACHEKHEFEWTGARTGSVELIHSDGQPLQLVFNLPYPKRRWFSPRKKDWKRLAHEAEDRFGPGHKIDVAGKTGLHFRVRDLVALISCYDSGHDSYIEVKLATGRFWC
jgi:hypothetical protein